MLKSLKIKMTKIEKTGRASPYPCEDWQPEGSLLRPWVLVVLFPNLDDGLHGRIHVEKIQLVQIRFVCFSVQMLQ